MHCAFESNTTYGGIRKMNTNKFAIKFKRYAVLGISLLGLAAMGCGGGSGTLVSDPTFGIPAPAAPSLQSVTGATKSLGDVIPELKGKIEGISIRVPTPNVSLVEFVFSSNKNLTIEKINGAFDKASKLELKSVLDTSNKPLVSSDFNHNPHSAIVDLSLTKVVDNKMAKVSAWYDNEWGFACRMCDLANYFGKI